jgi:hypothetical protein
VAGIIAQASVDSFWGKELLDAESVPLAQRLVDGSVDSVSLAHDMSGAISR